MSSTPIVSFRFIGGLACPFFVCVQCGRAITPAKLGVIVWDMAIEVDGKTELAALHQGECSLAYPWPIHVGSLALDEFLAQLHANSGMRPLESANEAQ